MNDPTSAAVAAAAAGHPYAQALFAAAGGAPDPASLVAAMSAQQQAIGMLKRLIYDLM